MDYSTLPYVHASEIIVAHENWRDAWLTFYKVTLGLNISGAVPWARAPFLIPAQLIACMCAGAVVKVMFPGDIAAVNTTLAPGMNLAQGVFAEMFFTAYLVFVILMLAAEKSKDTFLAPLGIGLALFVAEIPGKQYLAPLYERRGGAARLTCR